MKRISLDVSEELHAQFKQQAKASGFTTMAQWLRWVATNAIGTPVQIVPHQIAAPPAVPTTDVKATVEALKQKHLGNPYKDS